MSGVAHAVQDDTKPTRLHGSYENSKGGGREVGEVGSKSDPERRLWQTTLQCVSCVQTASAASLVLRNDLDGRDGGLFKLFLI